MNDRSTSVQGADGQAIDGDPWQTNPAPISMSMSVSIELTTRSSDFKEI